MFTNSCSRSLVELDVASTAPPSSTAKPLSKMVTPPASTCVTRTPEWEGEHDSSSVSHHHRDSLEKSDGHHAPPYGTTNALHDTTAKRTCWTECTSASCTSFTTHTRQTYSETTTDDRATTGRCRERRERRTGQVDQLVDLNGVREQSTVASNGEHLLTKHHSTLGSDELRKGTAERAHPDRGICGSL